MTPDPSRPPRAVPRTPSEKALRILLVLLFLALVVALLYALVPLRELARRRGLTLRQYFYLPLAIVLAAAWYGVRAYTTYRRFRRR